MWCWICIDFNFVLWLKLFVFFIWQSTCCFMLTKSILWKIVTPSILLRYLNFCIFDPVSSRGRCLTLDFVTTLHAGSCQIFTLLFFIGVKEKRKIDQTWVHVIYPYALFFIGVKEKRKIDQTWVHVITSFKLTEFVWSCSEQYLRAHR
jgi:hypothetical protein